MKPPESINVLDAHGGYTGIRRIKGYNDAPQWSGTCWHPGSKLVDPTGVLVYFKEDSFFQLNDNCTQAIYRVGRRYACVWFDNETRERL